MHLGNCSYGVECFNFRTWAIKHQNSSAKSIGSRYLLSYKKGKSTHLFFSAFTSTFVQVNVCFFQDNVGVSATDSLDSSHGKHHFAFAIDICVHYTKNVLKLLWDNQRLKQTILVTGLPKYLQH